MSSRNIPLIPSDFDASAEELSDSKLNVAVSPVTVVKKEKEEKSSSVSTDMSDEGSLFFEDSEEDDSDLSFVVNYFNKRHKKSKGSLTAEGWAKTRVSQAVCAATDLDSEDAGKIADNPLQ